MECYVLGQKKKRISVHMVSFYQKTPSEQKVELSPLNAKSKKNVLTAASPINYMEITVSSLSAIQFAHDTSNR